MKIFTQMKIFTNENYTVLIELQKNYAIRMKIVQLQWKIIQYK